VSNILVVTGSVRPNSVNSKVVSLVVRLLEQRNLIVAVADLGELQLPFYDDPLPPSHPEFVPTNAGVRRWTAMVADADAVVLVTPEYNHTMSPVQLNAIDWIYKGWAGKLVALIGYGWRSGAAQAHATAREALAANLKAEVLDTQANLFFAKDLAPDGSMLDEAAVLAKVNASLDKIVAHLG